MTSRLLFTTALGAVLSATAMPALAQDTAPTAPPPSAPDALVAVPAAPLDPWWQRLVDDGFGDVAWDAFADPALMDRIALQPLLAAYPAAGLAPAPVATPAAVSAALVPAGLLRSDATASDATQSPRAAPPAAATTVTTSTREIPGGLSENRYYLMHATQIFDGTFERAHAQKAGFARLRKGDESWVTIDYGDGAMVVREPGSPQAGAGLGLGRFVSTTPTEVAIAYDYRTNTMRGNSRTALYHNTYVRPLMEGMPALGSDAAWTVQLSAAKLGLTKAASSDFPMELKRTYITHEGTPYVILEYTVPEFSYGGTYGQKVTHRARGVALADPAMGQIYWNASLQLATADQAHQPPRRYRYARTSFAMDAAGAPQVDLAAIPELKPYLDALYSADATAPLPLAGEGRADQTPLQMASRIDIVGFTLAENSANQMGEDLGTRMGGANGNTAAAGASFDVLVQAWGIPDKLKTAFDGMTDLAAFNRRFGPDVRVAEDFLARTGISVGDFRELGRVAEHLGVLGTQIRQNAKRLTSDLKLLNDQIADKRAIMTRLMRGSETLDDLFNVTELSPLANQIKALEKQAASVSGRIVALDIQAARNAAATARIAPAIKALQVVHDGLAARGILGFAKTLNEVLVKSKLGVGLTVLSNVNNAETFYQVNNNLKNWDPARGGDLPLQGKYDTGGALITDITLNLLGIAGNIASGNLKSALSDTVTFATGRFTDLFFAMDAAKAADDQAKQAAMELVLTQMRAAKLTDAKIRQYEAQVADLGRRIAALRQERAAAAAAARAPGGVNDPNWRDPRFDPATGRPIPSYWAYLKANDPEALRRMGIDPDAPVGGWPNGVRPADRPQRQARNDPQPRQPGGPDYPTAPASTRNRPSPAPSGPDEPTLEQIAANGSRRPAPQPYTPPPRRPAPNYHIGDDESPITSQATSPFDVRPVNFDPVTMRPVEWTPVTWDPVTWEPVTWDPPEWTPPHFDAPRASDIPWTDLGSGRNWPHSMDNMAFDYGELSGRVETDLSAYDEWLRTQNVTYLEQLARTAGYPNLASALNDSASLIRKANDPGFYTWAWSPPAASGAINSSFSEGQHEMGRAAYMLGDLIKRSGLFDGTSGTRLVEGDSGLDAGDRQTLAGSGKRGFGPDTGGSAEVADAAYGAGYQRQRDRSGLLGRESGGRLAANLFRFEDPYLRQLTANGRSGLDALLAQPFNVVLTWGTGAFDLDLHMTGPLGENTTDRFHIYFAASGNLAAQPFAKLIKDCVCSSGSEVVLTSALNRGGVYRVSVFNFGNQSATSTNLANASQAALQIVRGGVAQSVGNGTTIVGGRTIVSTTVPTGQAGNTWVAAELDPRNGRITLPHTIIQSQGSGGVR